MSTVDPEQAASALQSVLGDEHHYRKFVRQLANPRSDGLIQFWQDAILDMLEAKVGLVLPRRAEELRRLLPPLPEPPQLAAAAVPEWIQVDELGGSAPVQGSGTAGAWRWYFRARHNSWSLAAILGNDPDPVDVACSSATSFYAEDDYGDVPDEASYMGLDQARFFIVRELTRLRDSRGLDSASRDQ